MSVPLVTVYTRVTVEDASGLREWALPPTQFGLGVGANESVQNVTLPANTFTPLSIPAGARLMLLRTTSPSLVLKGITGDSASLTLTPATNVVGFDQVFSLGASPVAGILNNASTGGSATLIFF